jgi:hypothetical protein
MVTRKRGAASRTKTASEIPVVYIHGIGPQLGPVALKREWDLALFGKEMGSRTRVAYWADILHKSTPAAADDGRQLDVAALLARAGVDAKDEAALALARALLRSMGVEPPDARTRVLLLPSRWRKPIARAFLKALVSDAAAYFFRQDVRQEIRKRLIDVLPATQEPVLVVAHSMGSIITLEVLAALKASGPVRVGQLITAGSPLGIQEVQDLLECNLWVPPVVSAWHNFADPFDMVALDKGLGNDFDPAGFITDALIFNTDVSLLRWKFHPHSAPGYLAHRRVREVAYRAAGYDARTRFVLARDVASSLAVDARHPVLVELLEPGYRAVDETPEQMRAVEKQEEGSLTLAARINRAADGIRAIVSEVSGPEQVESARIDCLRRFVAARLTPAELALTAHRHRALRIYAVWRSGRKRKLLHRSARVVQADAARESYGALGEGVRWAVLDTGVCDDHPHFALHKNITQVWNCTGTGRPVAVKNDRDRDGHGTHVSGIIAGSSADGELKGIAPKAQLVVYKVLDDDGTGEDAWIIKALDHIAEQNENTPESPILGVNLSLGEPYDDTVYGCGHSPLCAELRRIWRSGVLVVAASGNSGRVRVTTEDGETDLNGPMSIEDPANLEDCIAVGSVHADRPHLYGVSSFSSRGPTSDGRLKPDLVAPGESIRSCNSRFRAGRPDSLYCEESGTSMAAPHVSGLLAAFLSARKEYQLRPDEVKALLLRTCTDIGRDRYHQGHGIPNLMRMLLEC